MPDDLLEKVKAKTMTMDLDDNSRSALLVLSRDPYGVEQNAVPSVLASSLDISIDTAKEVVIDLLARKLLNKTESGRLEVDLGALGLTPEEAIELKRRRTVFVNHGAPHSPAAMSSLQELFQTSKERLVVALEVTSPHVFKELVGRARQGRKTIFLMPRKRHVPSHRRRHYDEVLQEWVKLFVDGDRDLRRYTELRITDVAFSDLYTSCLSGDSARFDVYFLDSNTTRDGDILQVARATTLYQLISARYEQAMARSCPIWRIWWFRALFNWLRRLLVPLFLLIVGVKLAPISSNPYAVVASTISLGLLVSIIYSHTDLERWYRATLFER